MQSGMTLHVVTAVGSINAVLVSTDGNNLTWSLKKNAKNTVRFPFALICMQDIFLILFPLHFEEN